MSDEHAPEMVKWAQRVDEADADAESAWKAVPRSPSEYSTAVVLRAIAAELRAQRIARRPGAGA
jgi:hypothetical protein